MSKDNPSIDSLRREIDRIDDAVHDLLMRRAEVVTRIAATKPADGVPLRPAREAQVLRRLISRHQGPFPKSAVVRIWREIMGAMSAIQAPLTVAVCDPGSGLARDHFGAVANLVSCRTAGQAVSALVDGQAAVAVVPLPADEEAEPWWASLTADAGTVPRVVGRLPFAGPPLTGVEASPQALVLACRDHDESGDDRSLVAVETDPDLSRDRLRAVLGAGNLAVTEILAVHRGVRRLHLVEVSGHLKAGDPRLFAVERDPVFRITVVGGYATPFTEPALA